MSDSTSNGELRLTTTLQPRGPAAAVVLSDQQAAVLQTGSKTPPVTVTVNGAYTFQGRVGRMGGETLVGFNKAVRSAAGVEAGDEIEVVIAVDDADRSVAAPDDLAAALAAEEGAAEAYRRLAPSHQKEYVRWITEAKRPDTRARRVAQAVERIRAGQARR